jgi:hypothetical protein
VIEPLTALLDRLIAGADPEGDSVQRLRRYREMVEAGTILGTKARRDIESCVQAADNIECAVLRNDGTCGVRRPIQRCASAEFFRDCPDYRAPRKERGATLGRLS